MVTHDERDELLDPPGPIPATNTIAGCDRRTLGLSRWLLVGLTLCFAAIFARVIQLQLAPEARLSEQKSSRITSREHYFPRGDIVDRRDRLIASTRVGHRVIVDPTLAVAHPDWHDRAGTLAGMLEADPGLFIGKIEAASRARTDDAGQPLPPQRYLALSGVLADEQAEAVRTRLRSGRAKSGLPLGISLEPVAVRDAAADEQIAAIVGKVGYAHLGLTGSELRLNDALRSQPGTLTYVHDRAGKPVWIEEGWGEPGTPGNAVRLSIDLELQRIAREELSAQVEKMNAAGGRLVMINPDSGEVLAMVDIVRHCPDAQPFPWVPENARGDAAKTFVEGVRYEVLVPDPGRLIHPSLARNRCVEDIYEPGSTFKPFVWSVITELGVARLDEVFDTEDGKWRTSYGRYLEDVTKRRTMTWREVLVNSSNIGMVKASERLNAKQLHDTVTRFGFGQRTNLGLPGEAAGIVTALKNWNKYTHTSVAYGHEVSVTPLQMCRAFSAFARTGGKAGTLPQLRLTSQGDEGEGVIYRVLPPAVAIETRRTMKHVVDAVDQRWVKDAPEGGWRYDLFGKSGTAMIPFNTPPKGMKPPGNAKGYYHNQFVSSFIAGGPVENPRLLLVAIIDDPGPRPGEARAVRYGSAASGPVARKVLERSLAYLGVPASPARMLTTETAAPSAEKIARVIGHPQNPRR